MTVGDILIMCHNWHYLLLTNMNLMLSKDCLWWQCEKEQVKL